MKKLIILLFIFIPFLGLSQNPCEAGPDPCLNYELGIGTTINSVDYFDDSTYLKSGTNNTFNFYFNIEIPYRFGSIYTGSGLILDRSIYNSKISYKIPIRVGMRL